MYELHCTVCDRLMSRDEVEIESGIIPFVVYCKDVEGCWQAFATSAYQHMLFSIVRVIPQHARTFADGRHEAMANLRTATAVLEEDQHGLFQTSPH